MIAWWYPIMVATGEKGKLGLLVTPKWAQALPLSPPTSLCIAEVPSISMSLFIFKRSRPGLHACPDLASEPKLLMSSPCPHCTWALLSWLKSLCTFSSCFSFIFHFLTPSSLVSATALYYDCFCPGQFWVCHLTALHTTPYWRALGPCFRGLPPPHTLFSGFPLSTTAFLFQPSLGTVHPLLYFFPRSFPLLFNALSLTKFTGNDVQLPTLSEDSESRPAFWDLFPELCLMWSFLLHVLLTYPREASTQHPMSAFPCHNLHFFPCSPSPWIGTLSCSNWKCDVILSFLFSIYLSLHPCQVDLYFYLHMVFLSLTTSFCHHCLTQVILLLTGSLPSGLAFFILAGIRHYF